MALIIQSLGAIPFSPSNENRPIIGSIFNTKTGAETPVHQAFAEADDEDNEDNLVWIDNDFVYHRCLSRNSC